LGEVAVKLSTTKLNLRRMVRSEHLWRVDRSEIVWFAVK